MAGRGGAQEEVVRLVGGVHTRHPVGQGQVPSLTLAAGPFVQRLQSTVGGNGRLLALQMLLLLLLLRWLWVWTPWGKSQYLFEVRGRPWIRGRPGTTVDQGQARDYRGSGAGHSGTTVDQGQATQGLPWIRGRPGTTVDQGQARELGTNGKVIVVIKILCHHDSIFTMVPPLS